MKLTNIIFVLLVFFPFYAKGKEIVKLVKDKKTNILFYDLNKNGKMDIYENPTFRHRIPCRGHPFTNDTRRKGWADVDFSGLVHV